MSTWIRQPFCPLVTRTRARCDVGSVSCEWWSVAMKGWGIRKWLAWWIKGVTWQPGVDFLVDGNIPQMDSTTYQRCVCVREKERSAPWNRRRPVIQDDVFSSSQVILPVCVFIFIPCPWSLPVSLPHIHTSTNIHVIVNVGLSPPHEFNIFMV